MPSQSSLRILLLGVSFAVASHAWAQNAESLAILQPKEKSTLETFPLASLEQDDLALAVINGTLDVPAAGAPVEASEVSKFQLKDPLVRDESSDVYQSRPPMVIQINPTPIPVGSRTYSHDYR